MPGRWIYDPDTDEQRWETGPYYDPEDLPQGHRSQWKHVVANLPAKGARCPALYEEAARLKQRSRKGKLHCGPGMIDEAVRLAFVGPCQRAKKAVRKLKTRCARVPW